MQLKIISNNQYSKIHKDEMEIFNQLTQDYDLILDEYGDLVLDENNLPVKGEKMPSHPICLSEENLFFELNEIDSSISLENLNNYTDVFNIDDEFLAGDYNVKVLGLFDKEKYQGSVWATITDEYIVIYGIKSSLVNFFQKKRGIATKILQEIEENFDKKQVIVLDPLESMIHLLEKKGYVHKLDMEKFLDNILDYPHNLNYYTKA